MRTLYHTYIYTILAMCFGLLPLASCSDAASPTPDDDSADKDMPYISIGMPRATDDASGSTEPTAEDYEATLQSLAILQKENSGNVRLIYRNDALNKVLTDRNATIKIYKDNLSANAKFDKGLTLYAVANYTGSSSIVNALPALNATVWHTAIENLITDDISIIEQTDNTKKNFVMSATATGGDITQLQCYATLRMERVAVKVRLNLHLEPPTRLPNDWVFVQWAPGNELPFARVEHKGGKGHLFQSIPISPRTDNNDELYVYDDTTGGDNYHLMDKISMTDNMTKGEFTATGYLYPRVWQTGDDKESYISLSIPYRFREKTDAANVYSDELYNYYKIRFADEEGNTCRLDRNAFYDVDVTIRMIGNTNLDDAVKIDGHVVKTHEWHKKEGEISIENHYIEVENYEFEMVNQLSFDFSASTEPVFYFSLGSKNFSLGGNATWSKYSYSIPYFTNNAGAIDIRLSGSYIADGKYINFTGNDQDVCKQLVNVATPPGVLPNFALKIPYLIYGSIVAGKITKPLHIYQYPHVHFKVTEYTLDEDQPIENNGRISSKLDYSTIVLHQGIPQYKNNSSEIDELYSYIAGAVAEKTAEVQTDGTSKEYILTYNQEDIQPYMARSFTVDKADIKITQTSTTPRDGLLYYAAVNACKKRQDEDRANGASLKNCAWRVPTLREMRVMYEAKEALKFQSGYSHSDKTDHEPYLSSVYKKFANTYAADDNIPSNVMSDGETKYKYYYVFGTQPASENNAAFLASAKDFAGWGSPYWTIKTINQFLRGVETGKDYYVRCVRSNE